MDHLPKVRRKRKSKSYHVTRFVRSSGKHIFSIAANIGKGQMSPEQRRERERASKKVGVRGAMWNMVALIATRHVRTDTVQVAIRQVFDFRGSSLIRVALCLCLHVGLCVCVCVTYLLGACWPADTWQIGTPGIGCVAKRPPHTCRPLCTRTRGFCPEVRKHL